jgi:hypothetical protein
MDSMKIRNIITCWKTTLVGLLLVGVDLYYLLEKDAELFKFVILLVIGIGFLFAPDTIVDGLKSVIKNNKDKKF